MILLERRGGRQCRVDCGPPSDPPKGVEINSNYTGHMLIMQPDGNLVILDELKHLCWALPPNPNILFNPNDHYKSGFRATK
jgi:hypothetical protein